MKKIEINNHFNKNINKNNLSIEENLEIDTEKLHLYRSNYLIKQKVLDENQVEVQDDTIHLVIGTAYMVKKQYKSAIDFFKIAYKFNPKKEQICNNLGGCYMSLGNYEAAINSFETSLYVQ